jgi:hypothetical protein
MAERDAGVKLRIYHTLYRLNLSFANIVAHCRALGESRVLTPKFTRLYQSYAQELQAEINDEVIDTLERLEFDDMFRFGKVRIAREKELRDPDDVFIHAEERRKQIARQQHKNKSSARKKALASSPEHKRAHARKERSSGREGRTA